MEHIHLGERRILKSMPSRLRRSAVAVAASGISLLGQSVQTLPAALRSFDQEHDLAKKAHELLTITQQHPDAGPALLRLAERTRSTDTRWMAMRGMHDVHFRGCEGFLNESLKSPDVLVRSNAARVIGDLGFQIAAPELLAMFAAEHDPRAVEQASLSLSGLGVKAGAPLIRRKIPLFTGQTRAWLLQALGTLGDRSDVPMVAGYLEDSDFGPQMMAAAALAQLTGLSFGQVHEGPTSLPLHQTLEARAWWSQHRESWPDCSDCPK